MKMPLKKSFLKKALPLITLVGLAGCDIYNSEFDCQISPGVPCESVVQINKRIQPLTGNRDHVTGAFCSGPVCPLPDSVLTARSSHRGSHKIWVNQHRTPDGELIESHNLWLSDEG